MTTISAMETGRCEQAVDALRAEFGTVMAGRILEAEAADFLWDARVKERYLGQHCDADLGFNDDAEELSRIAIMSYLAGRWHAGLCLVDGEGRAVELLWKRSYGEREEAEAAFDCAI